MKVLYLYNGPRQEFLDKIEAGEQPDDHLYGLLRLRKLGIETDFFDPAPFYRKYLSVYFVHLPYFLRLLKYDIVFSTTAYGTMFFLRLWPFRKPKFVFYDFSVSGLIGKGKNFKQKFFKWLVHGCAGIVTISEKEAKILINILPALENKIKFIPFSTDTTFFHPTNTMVEERQIITVGFDPGRDYETFFAATRSLGLKIVVTQSRKIYSCPNIPKYVDVKNFSWLDLVQEYSRSSLVVLPLDLGRGVNDAMGCSTLVQAMSCGRAIIATRTPTTESYIKSGENGLLIEEKNKEALGIAIINLLADPVKRRYLGENARKFILEYCNPEFNSKKLAEFLLLCNK